MSILAELKRRKMFQVIAVYAVVAWLIVQVITAIEDPLTLPEWTDTLVIVLLGLGFPIMLVVSWAFNITPDGLVRDVNDKAASTDSGRTIEFVLIGLVAVAVLWLIYRTEFSEAPPPNEIPAVADAATPGVLPNSIAVLPFANLSPDSENAFFAAGIHDSILNELAKIRDMRVISRTTMMRYADTEKSMPQIADELRVETVMEGSIQYANGRVLVTAQLIDPKTDTHLWSDNYNQEFADIFAIQSDIATRIAEALKAQVSPQEQESIREQMTSSPQAYAYYLQAMELAGGDISPNDYGTDFHDLLDKAIEADRSFARAYAIKARLFAGEKTGDALATEYAEKALELDPNLGLAHYALAYTHQRRLRNAEATREYEMALKLSPSEPNIMDDAARFYAGIGNFQLAIDLATRLNEIDPGFSTALASVSLDAGDFDTALQAARRGISFDAGNANRRLRVAILEHLLGNTESAQVEARIAMSLAHESDYDGVSDYYFGMAAYRLRLLGFADYAETIFSKFIKRAATDESVSVQAWATMSAAVGDYEKALEYLHLIAEEVEGGFKSSSNRIIAMNRYRDPVLETPEFVAIRKRLGYYVPTVDSDPN